MMLHLMEGNSAVADAWLHAVNATVLAACQADAFVPVASGCDGWTCVFDAEHGGLSSPATTVRASFNSPSHNHHLLAGRPR
jgi:hypothetical protein